MTGSGGTAGAGTRSWTIYECPECGEVHDESTADYLGFRCAHEDAHGDVGLQAVTVVALADVLAALRDADVHGTVGNSDQVGRLHWKAAFNAVADFLVERFGEGGPVTRGEEKRDGA